MPPDGWDTGFPNADPYDPQLRTLPDWAAAALDEDRGKPEPPSPQSEQQATQYHDLFDYADLLGAPRAGWFPLPVLEVPPGHVATIWQIQTLARGIGDLLEFNFYQDGNPLLLQSFGYAYPIEWRLCLHPWIVGRRRRRYRPRYEDIPIPCHPDLGPWKDGRFDWLALNARTRILVPEGHQAILWCGLPQQLIDSGLCPLKIGARLVATSQTWAGNAAAVDATRRGW